MGKRIPNDDFLGHYFSISYSILNAPFEVYSARSIISFNSLHLCLFALEALIFLINSAYEIEYNKY